MVYKFDQVAYFLRPMWGHPAKFMGPTWGRQGPGGPHFGPMNLAVWVSFRMLISYDVSIAIDIYALNTQA